MTFNTQNSKKNETSKNNSIADVLDASEADIIALQEISASGVAEDIRGRMDNGSKFASVESEVHTEGSFLNKEVIGTANALLYNTEVFELVESGFWQIGTKDVDGSNYDRFATYAKLKRIEDGAIILAVATHFDTSFAVADAQAEKLLELISENFGSIRTVIMGDYNVPSGRSEVHAQFTGSGYADAETNAETKVNADEYTFYHSTEGPRVIDYIYIKGFKSSKYEVVIPTSNPSDHRPVFAEIYIG